MDNMSTGLMLMLVGMITVFAILLIVIYGSQLLIRIVNSLTKEKPAAAKEDTSVDDILAAAVAQITGGKGRIVKVTKLD